MNDLISSEGRARRSKQRWATGLAVLGLLMAVVGVTLALTGLWVDDTTAGVMTGLGFGLFALGGFIVWMHRVGGPENITGPGAKRERMQAQRSVLLWTLPLVTAVFLFEGTRAVMTIHEGGADVFDVLRAALPVIYAWLAAAVTMGWDGNSRKHRKYLEDELTQALRARAVVWAFCVLMIGGTIALGLGLWRPEMGVTAIPFALVAAGAAASLRFAWLEREASRGG
ncbi:MAG: hypothetical protein K2X07_04295 [Caulobacteraceae bacterium]|nr:hypothetical protein [Caulobacteraceae bacterium]